MNPEGVLISYSIADQFDEQVDGTYFTASGIKFEDRWILTHGSLLSMLKTVSTILKTESTLQNSFPENKYYQRLPKVYVTYEKRQKYPNSLVNSSKDVSNTQYNFLNNIVVTAGKIKLIWRSNSLGEIFDKLFSTWSIGNKPGSVDSQDNSDKKFLPAFVLIDIGDTITTASPKAVLKRLFQYLSHELPQRSDELIVFGTPFGNEIFLNSLTKGAVCNVVGRTSNVLLCDAPTSAGFEGGPVFSKKSGTLLGMTISSLSWWRGEWVGITLIAFLSPILHEILHPLKSYKEDILPAPKDLPFVPLLDKIDHVVALVRCGEVWGSGVFIGKGYVLTCSHCVNEHKTRPLSIYLAGKTMKAKVLFRSREGMAYDLALLHVNELDSDNFVQLAKTSAFKGENVVAVGFPYFSERQIKDLKPTITKGTVNNISPYMIQTSCCVQSGFSGGAILRISLEDTLKCYLLGIIVCNAKYDENHAVFPNLNMAVPVDAFRDVFHKFLRNPSSTEVLRGFENPTQNVQSLWRLQFYDSKL